MTVKTEFSKDEFILIISKFDLGEYREAVPLTGGSVQTNFLLQTTRGKFVFRYYENRSLDSVLFECNLIRYLKDRNYPCPAPIKDRHGKFVGVYNQKPFAVFEFMEGHHIENPDEQQKEELIKKVAELHNLTRNYRPSRRGHRWNYNVELCRRLAREAAEKLNTESAREKLKWHEAELSRLELPSSLPKGVCHCDFHFSNVLFKDGKFNALIDFDDANYTYLLFDLVGLIETEAWRYDKDEVLDFNRARRVLRSYEKYRPLTATEKKHLFDVYKLSILFDCVWYFARGTAEDFYEKRKIGFLNNIGREQFYRLVFLEGKVDPGKNKSW